MPTYTPRLSSTGMAGSNYWYNNNYNPFYPTYGLPNCTCYAWGRMYEFQGFRPSGLYTGDAGTWWNNAAYQHGSVPKLGACICFSGGPYSGRGHVAIVEKIYSDGSILFSNSGYTRDPQYISSLYFYLRCASPADNFQTGLHGYAGYAGYTFQGFLYSPIDFDPDIDPGEPPTPGPGPQPDPGGGYPTKLLLYKQLIDKRKGRIIT